MVDVIRGTATSSQSRQPTDPELPGMLPALLISEPTPDAPRRRPRRSVRDWIVDVVCFVFAAGVWVLVLGDLEPALEAEPRLVDVLDLGVGVLSVGAVWLRRRWPVQLAIAMVVVSAFSSSSGGTLAIALFTVAVHRHYTVALTVAAASILPLLVYMRLRPEPELSWQAQFVINILGLIAVLAWGMFVRARRQLVLSLRERAAQAEAESQLRVQQARHLERERIAREMHDVLAHRLSLLSVHAGALEYRPDAPRDEIAKAAGVIRTSAHQALQDLREVIGILRAPADGGQPERPQPSLADLSQLVEESRGAGAVVEVDDGRGGTSQPPDAVSRCAYRVVQECLTNARKHAPGAPVTITLRGAPGGTLRVSVRNPLRRGIGSRLPGARIPGAGTGIIGLTERVVLAGGRLEHGTKGDDFLVTASLPWRLPSSPAAVDDKLRAGHEAGGRRAEEDDRTSDLRSEPDPAQRHS